MIISSSPLWRALAATANCIISTSRSVNATLPHNGRRKSTIVYDAVESACGLDDRTAAKVQVLEHLGLSADTRIVGYVGNMTRQKRPQTFVRMAQELTKTMQAPLAFVLIGDDRGGQLQATERLAEELGIAAKVRFVGFQKAVERWLAGFDVMLAPGERDSFGRTVVEAMLVGTPVVASDSGGHSELLRHEVTGMLAPLDDIAVMARHAHCLLTDPVFADRLAGNALTEARERFKPGTHADHVMKLYDAMFESQRPSARS